MRRLINQHPNRGGRVLLSALPFLLLIAAYLYYSGQRLALNPGDKLLPSPATIASTVHEYAFEEDERSGDYLFWVDTLASLKRLLLALGISAGAGLVLGLALGVLPYVRATFAPFVAALSLIPPLAVLPILFIVAGLGEVAKVSLIVIGVAPIIVRDLSMRAAELPAEQLIKAQTLGASTWQIVLRVVLPVPGIGLAVPDRRRGHRLDRGPRLPDLPRAPLPGDGRDPAVRGVDHAARLHDGLAAAGGAQPGLLLGRRGRLKDDPGQREAAVEELRRPGRAGKRQFERRRPRVRDHRRRLRLRQDHVPEDAARDRAAEQGRVPDRR
jgi:ABC-type nitrate/sulfonate/bicarbonate transport system permease component